MPNADVKEVRNIAILSHGAAGKTSLADAILYAAGAVDLMGSVDAGNSVFMHEPEEISRKITITSALGFADWKGVRINIIDIFTSTLESTGDSSRR
jgi:elongation factor G